MRRSFAELQVVFNPTAIPLNQQACLIANICRSAFHCEVRAQPEPPKARKNLTKPERIDAAIREFQAKRQSPVEEVEPLDEENMIENGSSTYFTQFA